MDLKTLRSQSKEAIQKSLAEAEQEFREMRFSLASHQMKQVHKVRDLRANIARMHMVLREKK